ncbi:DNA primase [Fictibacillus sp. WQ 8-8]|uniref:DNA primase n=1 Tax=unclassified Fictibacillus TaxID=2644029 RepID=UPI0007837706|nr:MULTISPECIES: DNA primase [unclassified Fictibacillus]MCQ6266258.1 DNA primase [Fictibacillus sp. WQ 8-8]MED2972522.1 DNA primase [Fictibacillus sp. B-59209]SFD67978.1 DNA primase [Bacillus sp. OV194]
MAERIPDELIEKVRTSQDIVELVSDYVTLKKQGRNYFGLCPFHGEKSPSFSVSPDKQIYHCFGCGAGGNAFSFLMNIEGFSFLESVKHIAQRTGIDLPQLERQSGNSKSSDNRAVMGEAHELLAKLFHHYLLNTEQGLKALDYLKGRGFSDEVISRFQIGFAPDSWDAATNFLSRRNFSLELSEKAGLLGKRDFDGKFFDRFRNRIMFPIWDKNGKVIGFGGRILDSGEPKYLNSPETLLFNKGKNLYALHLSRPEMRKKQQAVLFEGYVDTIAAWRAGVENGVATLGTSLTEDQAKLLKRNVPSVVICYDSDHAGVEASFRASSILLKAGCNVKIAKMPDGLDPDDYIQKYGAEKFNRDVIGASLTVMAFKIQYYRRGKNLNDEGERMLYIEEIIKEISQLPNAVEKDHYLRQLADEFNLSLEALKQQQFYTAKQQKRKKDNVDTNRNNNPRNNTYYNKPLLPAYHNAERILLAHMLKNTDVAIRVQELLGASFNIEEHNAVAAYLYAFYEEGNLPNVGLFLQRIEDDRLKKIASELAMLTVNEHLSDKEMSDYIRQITNYPKWLVIQGKEKHKKEAERGQDFARAAQIAMEILQMKKELKG